MFSPSQITCHYSDKPCRHELTDINGRTKIEHFLKFRDQKQTFESLGMKKEFLWKFRLRVSVKQRNKERNWWRNEESGLGELECYFEGTTSRAEQELREKGIYLNVHS